MQFITEDLLRKYPINLEIAKNQNEYISIPVHHFKNDFGTVLCGVLLSEEEIERINKEKRLYLCFQTFYQPLTPFKLLIGEQCAQQFIDMVKD